jgi:hypothetical protein
MVTRVIAAVAVLVSGYVHLDLWFAGTRHLHVVGPAFLLNAVAALLIAVLLVTWKDWLPLLLTVGFGAATLGAFVISATVGLYGVHESWDGGWQWTAAVSEAVAIVAGLVAAWREGYLRPGSRLPSRPQTRGSVLH